MDNRLLSDIKNYLAGKYQCHTIIVYGSYATNDFTDESDVDLVCFCDGTENKNDNTFIHDKQLDAWIYDTEQMDDPSRFLHIRNGITLLDDRGLGRLLLENINDIYNSGPEPVKPEEIVFLKSWLTKMLNRSLKGDVEGDFRFHSMLNDSLEIYFKVKHEWYLGPKKSLQWLQDHDREAYTLFSKALNRNAGNQEIEALIEHIVRS